MPTPIIKPGTRVIVQNTDGETPVDVEATVDGSNTVTFRCRADDGRVYWGDVRTARLANG